MLIEYAPFGNLLGYLRRSRGLNDTYYKDPDIKPQTNLMSEQLIKFAWQIADGMSYLSSKSVSNQLIAKFFMVSQSGKASTFRLFISGGFHSGSRFAYFVYIPSCTGERMVIFLANFAKRWELESFSYGPQ